ncbi:hypothetical protein KAR91_74370 [Candidatus Pacearchaeota archaeon]|nr:hypothetical protein [Candidatus Pacearchaeota archaeon]
MSDDKLTDFYDVLKFACGVSFLLFMTCMTFIVFLNLETSRFLDSLVSATLILSVVFGWGFLIVDVIIQCRGINDE